MSQVRAALVIQNCRVGRFDENLNHCLGLISRAAASKAAIVVFPEMNLTGYAAGPKIPDIARPLDRQWTGKILGAAEKFNITVLAGLAEKDRDQRIRATHLVFTPAGKINLYRKIHLAPQENGHCLPGNQIRVFECLGIRFGIQLCYDAHFPELSTAMALDKADVIFMPHASPRGTPEEKLDSWMRHMTARAFDNGVYIAAVNQCGNNGGGLFFPGLSLVIGPDGLLKSKRMEGDDTIHLTDIDLEFLNAVRSHRMRYFLPHRRTDLFS